MMDLQFPEAAPLYPSKRAEVGSAARGRPGPWPHHRPQPRVQGCARPSQERAHQAEGVAVWVLHIQNIHVHLVPQALHNLHPKQPKKLTPKKQSGSGGRK